MNRRAIIVTGALVLAAPFAGGGALAASDTCREWRGEHRAWKIEVVRRYLKGAPQRALDEALFEMMQREAYLTSCEVAVERARDEMVGWRLTDRVAEDYGSAVMEGVLEQGGFDLDLRRLFEPAALREATEPERPKRSVRRRRS